MLDPHVFYVINDVAGELSKEDEGSGTIDALMRVFDKTVAIELRTKYFRIPQ